MPKEGQVQKEKMKVKTKSWGCASQNWWKSKYALEKIWNVSKRSCILEKCKGRWETCASLSTFNESQWPSSQDKELKIERVAGWVQIQVGVVKALIHEQFWTYCGVGLLEPHAVGPVRHKCWWLVEVLLYGHTNRRLIRDGSPGRPPRLLHSSWALTNVVVVSRFYIALFSALEQTHCARMWFYVSE